MGNRFNTSTSRLWVVGFSVILVAFAFGSDLLATFRLAWQTEDYTHILLVLPVSLCLLFLESGKVDADPRSAPGIGLAVFVCGLGLACASRFAASDDVRLSLAMSSLVVIWIALALGILGTRFCSALVFPLLFLIFLVPVPRLLLDQAIVGLQSMSAQGSYLLFRGLGIPVLKNGYVLSLSSLDIEVAQECSGIRSSEMLLLTCLVLGHLYLRAVWRQLLFAALVVPIAVAKNALRIFTISMLGVHVDPGFLYGSLHRKGGIVFFAMGLGLLTGILWLLHRSENGSGGSQPLFQPQGVRT
jgi:exosortase